MDLKISLWILSAFTFSFGGAWIYVWYHNAQYALILRRYINMQFSKYLIMKPIMDISIAWLFGLFIPILTYLQAVYVITFGDFIIGVTVAMLAKEVFSWRKALLLIAKFVCWTFLLVSTYQFQQLLHIPVIPLGEFQLSIAVFVAGVIAYAEVKSIFKNIKSGFGIDIQGLISSKFSMLKEFNTEKKQGNDT